MFRLQSLLSLVCVLILSGCGQGGVGPAGDPSRGEIEPSSADPEIVSAHTHGVIGRTAPVRVRFVETVVTDADTGKVVGSPFTFVPAVDGTVEWTSPRELVFHPGDNLEPGRSYKVVVDLGKVRPEWQGKDFSFGFAVMHQAFWVEHLGLEAETGAAFEVTGTSGDAKAPWLSLRSEPNREARELGQLPDGTPLYRTGSKGDWTEVEVVGGPSRGNKGFVHSHWTQPSTEAIVQRFVGILRTADVADDAAVEKILAASQNGAERVIEWHHDSDDEEHRFEVRGLVREAQSSQLVLALDGAPIGVKREARETIAVPTLARFSLSSARALTAGDRRIELRFSDPVDKDQRLKGLIEVRGHDDVLLSVTGSIVHIDSSRPWATEETVSVRGLRDVSGRRLLGAERRQVSFAPMKPKVRFAGKGVIYPTSAGMTVPIEVVNLRSVTVEAQQVFSSNVPQFLQVNGLSSSKELERVGRTIWRKRIAIEGGEHSASRWVHLGLDISALLREHRRGLYRIKLSFDRGDIQYECADSRPAAAGSSGSDEGDWESFDQGEGSSWDWWGEGDGGDLSSWDLWEGRNNPCHPGYYREHQGNNTASRNVMVSNLGLTAKKGEDGRVLALVTDLGTAVPVAGAEVKLLDYQLQVIAEGRSTEAGMLVLRPERKPFVLEAHHEGNSAYLKLDRGGALAVAHFDVSGTAVKDGLKGFLYAERGVWRPGDDIHLNFVVLDEARQLPPDHPVHLELKDPRGRVVEQRTVARGLDGFYELSTGTSADAPTGNYTARVKVGGAVFQKVLRVETVVPNRLKIDLDFGTEMIKGARPTLSSTLSSRWLHGAIARNLETAIEVSLRPRQTSFARHADYAFNDPAAAIKTEPDEIFAGRLDENGQTPVIAPIEVPPGSPGMLTALFRTRVFEPGGVASMDEATIPLSPHDRYIGVKTPKGDKARGMLLTDTKHQVEVVAVNAEGESAGDGEVDVKLYKVKWRWWWEKGAETFADYAGSTEHSPVAAGTIKLKDGKGTWDFEVKYPAWGRYLLLAQDKGGTGHRTGKVMYIDWPGWAGRAEKENPGGASVLTVMAQEDEVEVGQTVSLNIPTPAGSRALVSLENGTGVLQTHWVTSTGDKTLWAFQATADMAPNIYAHVTLVQPHSGSGNDAPVRMYGVVPIEVFDAATKLAPQLTTAAVFEPESKATIEVSEGQGRAMTYTLAVVDEGLLGLTRFKTPNPWLSFNAKEALGVRTWDNFDMVAGAYGGAIEGLLAVGGDGADAAPPVAKADRFPPMVRALGPFRLAAGATARHEVDIPHYLGEVRVMVVAGRDGAFGSHETSVKVKKPLMLLATLPRVISVQEEVALPVSVFALEEGLRDVELEVEVEGPLEVVGDPSRKLKFAAPGDQMVNLKLRVGGAPGVGRVTVRARGGKEKVAQRIEIQVRHPGARVTEVHGGVARAGQDWAQDIQLVGVAGTNEALLEVSRVPPMDLASRLPALIRYPHGCLEQTTSSAFPQVYVKQLLELSPERQDSVRHNVLAAIDKLQGFQTWSGGFSYWPGSGKANPWATSYAGHFLLEAERAGYALPAGLRSKWIKHQRKVAKRWARSDESTVLDQAYRLYGLALAGSPELGAMNRLKISELSLAARWRLAAAYQLAGQPEAGRELIAGQSRDVPAYRELSGTFGSDLRDEAMILETLVLLGDPEDALGQAQKVSAALTSQDQLSTQTAAYALVAMARFASLGDPSGSTNFEWQGPDGKWHEVSSPHPLVQVPIRLAAAASSVSVAVRNPGKGFLSSRVISKGTAALAKEGSAASRLELTVIYQRADGQQVDATEVSQGTDFKALVTVRNASSQKLQELALSQVLPSGWETHGESPGKGEGFTYRDVRDDRVDTYFDLNPGEKRSFGLALHASFLGHFYLPAVQVEAMYDSTVFAREGGRWIDVVPITPES